MQFWKKTLCGLTAAAAMTFAGAQANADVLYSEDFSGQNGKGHNNGVTDVSGVDWTVNVNNGSYTATSDYMEVVNGVFESQDNDAQGDTVATLDSWQSPTFSIAGYTDLVFTFDGGASGDFEADTDDFIVQVVIDSSPETLFDATVDENAPGDPMFFGATQLGSLAEFSSNVTGTGTNAYILIAMGNNAGSEQIFFDNVTLEGTIPEPASLILLGLGGVAILGRRNRK